MLGQYKADYEDGKRPYYSQIKDRAYFDEKANPNYPFGLGYRNRKAKNGIERREKKDLGLIGFLSNSGANPVFEDMFKWLGDVLDDGSTYRSYQINRIVDYILHGNPTEEQRDKCIGFLMKEFIKDGGSKYMVNGKDYSKEMLNAVQS
jgi:hypothetical protein